MTFSYFDLCMYLKYMQCMMFAEFALENIHSGIEDSQHYLARSQIDLLGKQGMRSELFFF